MERGEVWWALIDGRRLVVILSADQTSELQAMQLVAPATADEKRGFVLLTGEQAGDPPTMQAMIAAAGAQVRAVGVEVDLGIGEGLHHDSAVRVALPQDGHIFCTWLVSLTPEHLIEQAGTLSPAKLQQLDNALRLAGIE